jgi:putative ABC transport system permease protein
MACLLKIAETNQEERVMTTLTESVPAIHEPASPVLILEPLNDTSAATVGLGEVFRLALDSLFANKARALLTMLGVIIGVASVVTLIALGGGASNAITGQFTGLGTDVLTVIPGSANNRGPGAAGAAQTLTLADAEAIAAFNLPISDPSPQLGGQATLVAAAADKSATITGIVPAYQQIDRLTLAAGQFIADQHVSGASKVVVLGNTLAKELFGSGQAVGQTVRINGQIFRVIGVLEVKGSNGFGSVDDQALVPLSVAQRDLFGGRTPDGNGWRVSQIRVAVDDTDAIASVEQQLQRVLREQHQLNADGTEDDFQILNQSSFLSTLNTVTSLMTFFLAAVAGISLLVGGIGIMNIMLVSVTERTREIGLRKAVGARPRDILTQFVVEALVLSTTGGLIGLIVGSIIPIAVTLLGVLEAPVTLNAVLLSVGFSMAVGLFFGIYPAQRAAQLNPIQALRHE